MTPETVFGNVLEQVLKRPLADAAQPFRRQLETPFMLFDQAGLFEAACESLQLCQRLGGVPAEELSDTVEINLAERPGLRSAGEHFLELIELAQTLEHIGGLRQPEAVAAAEGHLVVPLLAREGRP